MAEERERSLDCEACVLPCAHVRVRVCSRGRSKGAGAAHPREEKPISTRLNRVSKIPEYDEEVEVVLAPLLSSGMSAGRRRKKPVSTQRSNR